MKKLLHFSLLLCFVIGATCSLPAQTAEPPPTQAYQPLADQDLDQLIGPIALYPDPLIAQILPASTLPTQIVMADRYLQAGGDPNQIDQQPWDSSVQAVARYPNVLKWLDDNLTWTTELGQAFLNQQEAVMDSVQRLRASAQNLGNLQTTPQQQVIDDGGEIEIVPADPDVIYVPVYLPQEVYYDSGGPYITFGVGCAIGAWLNCDFDWGHRHLFIWGRDHPRPANWWHERGTQHNAAFAGHNTTVWHPTVRHGVDSSRGLDRGYNNTPAPHGQVPHPAPVGQQHQASENNFQSHENVQPHDNNHVNNNQGAPGNQPPKNSFTAPQQNFIAPQQKFIAPQQPFIAPQQQFIAPQQHAPAVEHTTPAPAPDTFIGIQNSRDTRSFSDRGQQSMGSSAPRSAPAPAPAPVQHSAPSGGGGGGNSGGGGGGGGHSRH